MIIWNIKVGSVATFKRFWYKYEQYYILRNHIKYVCQCGTPMSISYNIAKIIVLPVVIAADLINCNFIAKINHLFYCVYFAFIIIYVGQSFWQKL